MSDLKSARLAEGNALAALIVHGQEMRRLLERLALDETVTTGNRSICSRSAADWLDLCRRYAEASAARAIARQRPILPGHGFSKPKERRRARTQPQNQ